MSFKVAVLTILGTISLVFGVAGAFLPVLPTTPFVLLAAACYGNTPMLQAKIKKLPFFKEYFESYQKKMGIPIKTVLLSLAFLWVSLIVSMVIINSFHLTIFLLFVGAAVSIHLLWMSQSMRKMRNNSDNKRKNIMKFIEFIFDGLYLISGLIISILILIKSQSISYKLAGFMGLILVFGDSFHLIPRIHSIITNDKEQNYSALGIGKMITSITMTIFYMILYYIGISLYQSNNTEIITSIMWILAILRIVFCLLPQNQWKSKAPSQFWGVIRNIPFVMMGIIVLTLFWNNREIIPQLSFIWLGILLSFLFYIPVVLWGQKKPALGSFMLPKSCAYIWIMVMFLMGA